MYIKIKKIGGSFNYMLGQIRIAYATAKKQRGEWIWLVMIQTEEAPICKRAENPAIALCIVREYLGLELTDKEIALDAGMFDDDALLTNVNELGDPRNQGVPR